MILTDDNISQSKNIETSESISIPTNIGLLIEKYYFAITIKPLVFKINMIEYTKTNKYFLQII